MADDFELPDDDELTPEEQAAVDAAPPWVDVPDEPERWDTKKKPQQPPSR